MTRALEIVLSALKVSDIHARMDHTSGLERVQPEELNHCSFLFLLFFTVQDHMKKCSY